MSKWLSFSLSIVFLLICSTAFAATQEKKASPQRNVKKTDFGVKSIDPFQKVEEKKQTTESGPNPFLGILQEKIVIPDKKKRSARKQPASNKSAPQRASGTLEQNPFEDAGNEVSNPFADAEVDFDSASNPFVAGDPFAYEYIDK